MRWLTLAATALGSAIAFLDSTVVIVALPQMESDLELGLAGQQWVILSYTLALSALYLPSGAIGDRVGLRRLFIVGTLLFAIASGLCAFADTELTLIAGRALQGVGGAALTTSSLALLRVTWAGQEGRAIGLWTSLTSVATIGGPAVGGLIVELASWRWVFVINLPLAVVVVALALAGRKDGETSARRSTLDVVGSSLAAIGLTGVSFMLVEVGANAGLAVFASGLVGVCALGALAVWTLRAGDPLVPLELLRRPGLVAANVVTIAVYACLSAQLVFLPVFLQFVGFSPVAAGLAFSIPSLGLVFLAARAGRLADRFGPRRPIAAGAVIVAVAQLLLLLAHDEKSTWIFGTLSLALFAVGLAAIVSPITAAALSPAPEELSGVASGLNQTAARAGGVVSIAAVGALAGWVFTRAGGVGTAPFDPALTGEARDADVESFHAIVLVVFGLACLSAVLAAMLLRDREPA